MLLQIFSWFYLHILNIKFDLRFKKTITDTAQSAPNWRGKKLLSDTLGPEEESYLHEENAVKKVHYKVLRNDPTVETV